MIFTLMILLSCKYGNCQQKQLLDHLFSSYRKELRPVRHENSGPTNVTVQLYFKQIQKVQENDQILTLYCWLEEYWNDEFLVWNPDEFDGIKEIHVPADMIWRPDLLVYNNANMNVKDNEMQTNALVHSDGSVSLFRAIITDITCNLNLHRFPFDQQICWLMLASWSYDGSQIMIQVAEEAASLAGGNTSNLASLTHYIPNMEWRLVDFKYHKHLKYYECCPNPYPDLCYYFAIKRNPSYYLFTLIVPSAFITIVTVVGFFTPHSSTGENTEKVSLGVTSLLSLAIILMMVSDKLPATSNSVPLLGQYYIGLIMIMFTATYCTTWTLGIQMQGNAGKTIPRRIRLWILNFNHKNPIVNLLFGRELKNTQQSIKLRMRKFDKLSALKRHFAQEFMLFQQKFIYPEVSQTQSNAESPEMSNANGGCQQHNFLSGANNYIVNSLMGDILNSVKAIRQDLMADEHLRTIRNEWQMLARMIEKILMLLFTTFTIVFAAVMLYDNQDPPVITEEIMGTST
ncbi:CRE-ACR-17 protein [Aphelenchoides avenae]|nr:CRE-ACR-17 protein [Aphelenchus avenae]